MVATDDPDTSVSSGSPSRRSFLKYTGAAGAVSLTGLAGCIGDDEEPTDDDHDHDDDASGADDDDGWPDDRIRLIIPFSEGGGTDNWNRNFIPAVSEELGVQIEIDNVPGAASLRGTGELVMSEGDGYTLGAFNPPSTPVSYMMNPQDWEIQSLQGICRYARQAWCIYVNPDTADEYGIENVDDLQEVYQAGDLTNFGGQQRGGVVHVQANLLRSLESYDIAWESYVGYDGGGPLVQAVAAGEVPVGITTPASGVGAIDSGDVRVIAVLSSDRDPMVPDVESVTEQGYENIDYIGQQQRCHWAPEGTPESVIQTWADAVEGALESDRFEEWAEDTGNEPDFGGPEEAQAALDDTFEVVPDNVDIEGIREQMDD